MLEKIKEELEKKIFEINGVRAIKLTDLFEVLKLKDYSYKKFRNFILSHKICRLYVTICDLKGAACAYVLPFDAVDIIYEHIKTALSSSGSVDKIQIEKKEKDDEKRIKKEKEEMEETKKKEEKEEREIKEKEEVKREEEEGREDGRKEEKEWRVEVAKQDESKEVFKESKEILEIFKESKEIFKVSKIKDWWKVEVVVDESFELKYIDALIELLYGITLNKEFREVLLEKNKIDSKEMIEETHYKLEKIDSGSGIKVTMLVKDDEFSIKDLRGLVRVILSLLESSKVASSINHNSKK